MTNSVVPDQMLQNASDLGLHRLLRPVWSQYLGYYCKYGTLSGFQHINRKHPDIAALMFRLIQVTTKTYLYNFNPLKPHFYIEQLGFTGVHYFSYFCSKHRVWVLIRTASARQF